MPRSPCLACIVCLLAGSLCSSSALAKVPLPDAPKEDTTMPAEANNAFACDLYARLAKGGEGNLFCSPYSIETALAMTLAGAKGETAGQMAKVLHLDAGKTDDVH